MKLELVCKRCQHSLLVNLSSEDYFILKEIRDSNDKSKICDVLPNLNQGYKNFFITDLCKRCYDKDKLKRK